MNGLSTIVGGYLPTILTVTSTKTDPTSSCACGRTRGWLKTRRTIEVSLSQYIGRLQSVLISNPRMEKCHWVWRW